MSFNLLYYYLLKLLETAGGKQYYITFENMQIITSIAIRHIFCKNTGVIVGNRKNTIINKDT